MLLLPEEPGERRHAVQSRAARHGAAERSDDGTVETILCRQECMFAFCANSLSWLQRETSPHLSAWVFRTGVLPRQQAGSSTRFSSRSSLGRSLSNTVLQTAASLISAAEIIKEECRKNKLIALPNGSGPRP